MRSDCSELCGPVWRQSDSRLVRQDDPSSSQQRRRSGGQQRPAYHRHRTADPRTKAYMAKRTAEGHSKLEVIRVLKRYIAREVFSLITQRRHEINQAQFAA